MQYVGIQTQQSRNNLRSAFLLFLFPCLVAALLYLACYLLTFMGYKEDMEVEMMPIVNHFFFSSLPYTMGIVLIWFLIAYWANTSIINSATGSKPLNRQENKRVYNLVENLCMSQGMKMPKINIIYDSSLNAFASGINERTYTVTLSEGIIQKLNDEELEAVIAHELSHIRNHDVRLLIISIVFVGIFSMLTEITFYAITHIRVRSNSKGSGGVVLFILIALGYPFWVAIIMGSITGAAGGVIRDVFINEIPLIFRKEIYAMACVVGGIAYWLCDVAGLESYACQLIGGLAVFLTRILAVKYHICLPILKGSEEPEE